MTPPFARRLVAPARRWRAERRFRTGPLRRHYPSTAEELERSDLARAPWHYSIELLPGVVMQARNTGGLPSLPRIMLRRCDLAGASCVELGPMEGLFPVLMKRGGAREVLAVDYSDHRLGQLDAVRHYHGVDFDFRTVGLMYDLHRQLRGRSFDLVNCSGLLYHVFSPLSILAAIRPLVKRGGIVLVSTSVTLDNGYTMDFNAGGRMLAEVNTFWYLSARLFDYMLRYMRLAPIDCAFMPHSDPRIAASHSFDKPSGYVSVACRAVDHAADDDWMGESAASAWEYHGLSDWERADRQPKSTIGYRGESGDGSFDLVEAIRTRTPVTAPGAEEDSHLLRLSATS